MEYQRADEVLRIVYTAVCFVRVHSRFGMDIRTEVVCRRQLPGQIRPGDPGPSVHVHSGWPARWSTARTYNGEIEVGCRSAHAIERAPERLDREARAVTAAYDGLEALDEVRALRKHEVVRLRALRQPAV
jgi:hypothetical protein